MLVSIVIATKDRKEMLRAAIRSALIQNVEVEVIVLDDGSTDGTSEMVAAEFPGVLLDRSKVSLGYIVQRNRGVELARSNLVVMIDDDCTFEHPETIQQAIEDARPEQVGAVAIPFVNIRRGPEVRKRAPSDDEIFVTSSFIGCAHLVKRDLFLKLGGYWPPLRHYWEEADYCFRLLAAGYITRIGRSKPVTHHYSDLARGTRRQRYFAARNTCMFAWHNVPWPYFPLHLLAVSAREARSCVRYGYPWATISGVGRGWVDGLRCLHERHPATAATYRLFREIKAKEPVAQHALVGRLPDRRFG
ncbi:MAG: glycosyltransferase family A protein [Planctomycetia bacterium]|nr:glycosyltransferase family A protein [Planctomycetia bacterium]